MHRWNECYSAEELDALAGRRRRPGNPDDEETWNDLGTLVARLMCASRRLPVGRKVTTRHQVCEIFNYWDQRRPPDDVVQCLASWTELGVPVQTYDYADADDFLRDEFGGDVLDAFRYAHHPAMQSDLFRLGRLYRLGGLYVDADDVCRGAFAPPTFTSGVAAMPLAVCRACERSTQPVVGDPGGAAAWYYLGNAPLFSVPGHPLIELALERAVAAVQERKARGELAQIHRDTGPVCLSMAALDYAMACFVAQRPCDLSVSPDWTFIEQSRPLAYKQTTRNWRTNAVLYSQARPSHAPDAGRPIDLEVAAN
jgi:hypothetical protein